MATLVELDGRAPQVGDGAWLAPTATLIGAVDVAPGASVWFGAVLRADFDAIRIGRGSSVQDNAVLHCADGLPTVVGADVVVGHMAMLEGCVVEDGALVGMGAIVLQRARVGAGAMVAAGAVVTEGGEVPPGTLAAGTPARVRKELHGASAGWVRGAAREYQALRDRYGAGAVVRKR
ncbi:MAG TPA: gamma carbonic anhydrase family protein [Solirubrobacteraceae bacterium]|nr:gamma carbonic anhydrase family protein [Solirubrobacteraceae bacterium]